MATSDGARARRLADALRLRQGTRPDEGRAAMIDELDDLADRGGSPADAPGIVGVVERSSLGTPAARLMRSRTSAEDIVHVLDLADRLGDRLAGGAPRPIGPIADWIDEMGELAHARPPDEVLLELHGLGFARSSAELAEILSGRRVCADRELMRSVVTVLGGDWTGGGYDVLYDAALDQQTGLDGAPLLTRWGPDGSGLDSADQLTGGALGVQVLPPTDALPSKVRGRAGMLAELGAALDEPTRRALALVGKGGCGKSTVALVLAKEALRRGHHAWWVKAGDTNQLTRGMLAVATQLGATMAELNIIQSAPEENVDRLWALLEESPKRWLLVLDDADEPAVLGIGREGQRKAHCWVRPSTAGTLLVTSRVSDRGLWGPDVDVREVGDLDPADGARVILDRLAGPVDDPQVLADARALSTRLGGVPLALSNGGDYLGSGRARRTLAQLVHSPDAMQLADTHVTVGPRGRIATTWDLSLAALAEQGVPQARSLLRLLSCYAPNWVVPLDVLAYERLYGCGLEPAGTGSPAQWRAALDGLCDVGLVTRHATPGQHVEGVQVHPLVAEVSQLDDKVPDVDAVVAAAVELLWHAVGNVDAGRPSRWRMLRRLEPHVYAVVERTSAKGVAIRAAALRLADRTAEGLIRAGLFALGEELIRHAVTYTDLGPEHPRSLAAEGTLAWALGLRGQLADAESRLRELVRARRRRCGDEHEATLTAREHLAWVLGEQGRLDEAARMLSELLPIRQSLSGPASVETLATRHRLAWVTARRGRPDEAEAQLRDVLPRRLAALGPDHIDVWSTRYRLAWAIGLQGGTAECESRFVELARDIEQALLEPTAAPVVMVRARLAWVRAWSGRFAQAEADFREVLRAREETIGVGHPRTLMSRSDLGWTQWMQGNHHAAERAYRDVLAECDARSAIGKDHPVSLDTRTRLAQLLIDRGRLEEAERRLHALVPHRRRVSGPDDPRTLIVRRTLGAAMMARGQYQEAHAQLEVVVADHVRVLGERHRHTLTTRALFATLLALRGDLAGARHELEAVVSAQTRTLGPDHPRTLHSRHLLVWVLGEREDLVAAEHRCRVLLADRGRVLGADHPDTLDTRYRLAWLLGLAGRGADAGRIYRALVEEQHRVLGRDHPHSLRTRHGLANELLRARRYVDAERALRDVLLDRTRVLGRRHPDTLSNRHSLALARALRGELDEAEQSLRDVLRDQQRELGPEHRHTLDTRERLAWIQGRQGHREEAAEHWRMLLRDRARHLGPDHPDTARARARLATRSSEVPRLW